MTENIKRITIRKDVMESDERVFEKICNRLGKNLAKNYLYRGVEASIDDILEKGYAINTGDHGDVEKNASCLMAFSYEDLIYQGIYSHWNEGTKHTLFDYGFNHQSKTSTILVYNKDKFKNGTDGYYTYTLKAGEIKDALIAIITVKY